MNMFLKQYQVFIGLSAGILVIFVLRSAAAARVDIPRLFELFELLIVLGSLVVLAGNHRLLHVRDWITALILGGVVGVGMLLATLFTPYPYFEIVRSSFGQAVVRGGLTGLTALGGLAIMRLGGPVYFLAAEGEWRKSGQDILFGLLVGLPLAVVNIFALQVSEGKAVIWQNPLTAMLDALQPGIVEEVVYRFAFLGLLWLLLRRSVPDRAAWLAGLLAMLVHTYAHFSDLFVHAPLVAVAMGLVLALLWGLPLTYLALRRGLDAAIAFHWIQDVARFLAGF